MPLRAGLGFLVLLFAAPVNHADLWLGAYYQTSPNLTHGPALHLSTDIGLLSRLASSYWIPLVDSQPDWRSSEGVLELHRTVAFSPRWQAFGSVGAMARVDKLDWRLGMGIQQTASSRWQWSASLHQHWYESSWRVQFGFRWRSTGGRGLTARVRAVPMMTTTTPSDTEVDRTAVTQSFQLPDPNDQAELKAGTYWQLGFYREGKNGLQAQQGLVDQWPDIPSQLWYDAERQGYRLVAGPWIDNKQQSLWQRRLQATGWEVWLWQVRSEQ